MMPQGEPAIYAQKSTCVCMCVERYVRWKDARGRSELDPG